MIDSPKRLPSPTGSSPFRDALVLTGPTASGKSGLAVQIAQEVGAEIISMDSMAVYRGMDIGTAKPSAEERRVAPHHLIDVLDPWEASSVAWWLEQATECCKEIRARGNRPLFVGGTPLYLKALLFGLFEGPPADKDVRRELECMAHESGAQELHAKVRDVDPLSAARLHPNDVRRLVRALEVWQLTGRPISAWQHQWKKEEPPVRLHCWWIDWPRDQLYSRINARTEQMFANGLVEEVASLWPEAQHAGCSEAAGVLQAHCNLRKPLSREARQALGYKEVIDYLAGNATLQETIASVQTRSRQFAKRQITWFRHLPGCKATPPDLTLHHWKDRMEGVRSS